MSRDNKISKIVKECKLKLYETFVRNARYWWKEEDLQSYLYHLLLTKLPKALEPIRITHREYPLIKSENPRKWVGVIDIAILEPPKSEFEFFGPSWMIRDAIELKFLRNYRRGFSSGSDAEFKKGFKTDYEKLMQTAMNLNTYSHKHLLFFRKIDRGRIPSPFNKVKKLLENGKEISIEGIGFSYIEVYEDGTSSNLLNNLNGRVVERALFV